MEYRQLQHSELTLSAIAFGAWAAGGWMWGQTDRHEAIKAMRAAYAEGMTSFDTAPIYGQGESEEIVGEALQDIPRDKVQILTKFGLRWDLNKGNFYVHSQNNQGKDIDIYKYAGKESIIQECENSLKRLKTDYRSLSNTLGRYNDPYIGNIRSSSPPYRTRENPICRSMQLHT